MSKNKGKKFEDVVRSAFEKVPGVSIDRVHDQTTRYKGSTNICDFIVYREPYEYYFECKSVHGNTLSIYSIPKLGKDNKLHGFYGNIRDNQWEGLLEKSKIKGVYAGIICWWVDHDATAFLPINMLRDLRDCGDKSVHVNGDWQDFYDDWNWHWIDGTKKRVYFDYDMRRLLDDLSYRETR